ncbi:MAG: 50S ribosomal protein L2, partial [Minisyncoccales bacterium]
MSKKLSNKKPEKSLTTPIKKKGGRNSSGRRTADHRGGGEKRRYRKIDFKRTEKMGVPAEIIAFEYDRNRSAHIALIEYEDGEKSYIIAPKEAKVGDKIMSADKAEIKVGNRTKLKNIPVGAIVYNIELEPKRGGKMARSAGTSVKLLA